MGNICRSTCKKRNAKISEEEGAGEDKQLKDDVLTHVIIDDDGMHSERAIVHTVGDVDSPELGSQFTKAAAANANSVSVVERYDSDDEHLSLKSNELVFRLDADGSKVVANVKEQEIGLDMNVESESSPNDNRVKIAIDDDTEEDEEEQDEEVLEMDEESEEDEEQELEDSQEQEHEKVTDESEEMEDDADMEKDALI